MVYPNVQYRTCTSVQMSWGVTCHYKSPNKMWILPNNWKYCIAHWTFRPWHGGNLTGFPAGKVIPSNLGVGGLLHQGRYLHVTFVGSQQKCKFEFRLSTLFMSSSEISKSNMSVLVLMCSALVDFGITPNGMRNSIYYTKEHNEHSLSQLFNWKILSSLLIQLDTTVDAQSD